MKKFILCISVFCLLLPAVALTQGVDYIKANYTKYEYLIPMRDGVRLFTAVYVPKDRSRTYPIMLTRTPYSVAPYGVDQYRASLGPSELFAKDGFIFAYQDVRGRYMSEGEWVEVRPHKPAKQGPRDIDESSDTYDTIDWLVKNIPNNNGRVGMWGISYPGFYTAAGIIDAHPALKVASPQAPIADYFLGDDSFHNGAFFLAANFGFYANFYPRKGGPAPPSPSVPFDYRTPDGYDFFLRLGPLSNANALYFKGENPYWDMNLIHTTYDDFWKSRSIWRHLKDIKPAIMTVGGWFDAEDLAGPLRVYSAIEKNSPGIFNMLVMGPWAHGGWARGDGEQLGNLHFASKTAVFYREQIEFPFFAHYLKDRADPKLPEAYVFGTGINEWRAYDKWPPASATRRTLYFRADGKLSFDPPSEAGSQIFDEYISDPNKPVPYLGYTAMGMTRDYMTEDQRFAATRPDVLVYETEPLASDITVTGPITVNLFVSTSGTDSDFVVKLIDVYPNDYPNPPAAPGAQSPPPPNAVKMGGYQQLVRGEPLRGKFRNSFEKPEPFEPGKVARIEFSMPDVHHTFRKGHRIMVQVQSSWFPLVDRNPQKFMDIPKATAADFQKATQRVYRSSSFASSVTVLVEAPTRLSMRIKLANQTSDE